MLLLAQLCRLLVAQSFRFLRILECGRVSISVGERRRFALIEDLAGSGGGWRWGTVEDFQVADKGGSGVTLRTGR